MAVSFAQEHKAFWASLPTDELLPMEAALRQVLVDWLHAKKGPLPLTEWVDRRVGGEIESRRSPQGFTEIALRGHWPIPAGGDGGSAAAAPPMRQTRELSIFLRKLPEDSFSAGEEALRDAVYEFFATWRSSALATLRDLERHPLVSKKTASFLPKEVRVAEWIEHRIGGEVTLDRSQGMSAAPFLSLTPEGKKAVMAKHKRIHGPGGSASGPPPKMLPPPGVRDREPMAPPPPGARDAPVVEDEFFAGLPQHELGQAELQLRGGVLDYMLRWRRSNPKGPNAGLSALSNDPAIMSLRQACMPKSIKFRSWLERRIGGEVEMQFSDLPSGDYFLAKRGQMLPWKRDAASVERSKGSSKTSSQAAPKTSSSAAAFLDGLPEDELTPAEHDFREAVLSQLEGGPVSFAELTKAFATEPELQELRAALLPNDVSIQSWVDHRMGGEVESYKDPQGRRFMRLSSGEEDAEAEPGKEEDEDAVELPGIDVEEFFASLPGDEFLPGEEQLRDALILFLEERGGKPALITEVNASPEIEKLSLELLASSGVELAQWIQRRIGGEIDISKGPKQAIRLKGQEPEPKRRRQVFAGAGP